MNDFQAYRTLGVHPACTDEEIKAAHRSLSRKYHPDRDGGVVEDFVEVQQAFQLIKDSKSRHFLKVRLEGVARGCHACGGKGYINKSRNFIRISTQPCEKCDRCGYLKGVRP